jgi:hypothetical protein
MPPRLTIPLGSAIKKLSQVREQLASCYFRIVVANEWLVSFRASNPIPCISPPLDPSGSHPMEAVAKILTTRIGVATSMSLTNPANATRQKHAALAETLRKRDSNRCTTTWAASVCLSHAVNQHDI